MLGKITHSMTLQECLAKLHTIEVGQTVKEDYLKSTSAVVDIAAKRIGDNRQGIERAYSVNTTTQMIHWLKSQPARWQDKLFSYYPKPHHDSQDDNLSRPYTKPITVLLFASVAVPFLTYAAYNEHHLNGGLLYAAVTASALLQIIHPALMLKSYLDLSAKEDASLQRYENLLRASKNVSFEDAILSDPKEVLYFLENFVLSKVRNLRTERNQKKDEINADMKKLQSLMQSEKLAKLPNTERENIARNTTAAFEKLQKQFAEQERQITLIDKQIDHLNSVIQQVKDHLSIDAEIGDALKLVATIQEKIRDNDEWSTYKKAELAALLLSGMEAVSAILAITETNGQMPLALPHYPNFSDSVETQTADAVLLGSSTEKKS
jgi:hypothetical protein